MADKIYIYGKHAVAEAVMSASRAVVEVYADKNFDDEQMLLEVKRQKLPFQRSLPRELDRNANHQGIAAALSPARLMIPLHEFVKTLKADTDTSLILLGELEDPQNVGAVIRSAAAFGVSGVLIPEHNQAPVTGAVIKVSAGMAFKVPLVSVANVNTAVRELKEKGFWVYGLAGEAKELLNKEVFDAPALFILGNESEGIRAKTAELCDKLLSIPIHTRAESLNAAASAAVALYEWSRQHHKALR